MEPMTLTRALRRGAMGAAGVIALAAGLASGATPAFAAEEVAMPDADLRDCVAWELGHDPGDPITDEQLASLTELDCAFYDIEDLTGIEYATGLHTLFLDWNWRIGPSARGIEPLAGLGELRRLGLDLMNLADLAPLAGLTKLETLDIGTNLYDSAQLQHLAALSELEVLVISDSVDVTDLSPIAGLTGLRELYAQFVPVTSVAPLAGMADLEALYLNYRTAVTDLTPLAGLTNLSDLALDDQVVRLPDAVVGEPQPNPVRSVDGSPVPSPSEFYDAHADAFVFQSAGDDVETEWSTTVTIGGVTAVFSGVLVRDVVEAQAPAPEASVDPASVTASALAETGVTVSGVGFPGGAPVVLSVNGVEIGSKQAGADGRVSFAYTSNALGTGSHAVALTAGALSAETGFSVTADPPPIPADGEPEGDAAPDRGGQAGPAVATTTDRLATSGGGGNEWAWFLASVSLIAGAGLLRRTSSGAAP